MSIQRSSFGKTRNGINADLLVLTNSTGHLLKLTNYGARITEIHMPDRDGKLADVTLGYDNLEKYLTADSHFGCTTGRVCNRIAKGTFELDGVRYSLPTNNGPDTLHGGPDSLDKKVWEIKETGANAVAFSHLSLDGEMGFPGNLAITVTYTFDDEDRIRIDFVASTDKPTPVNLTNHAYFNLSGAGSGTILDHEVVIFADQYTPTDLSLIPTGQIAPVLGTPLDFTKPARIGDRLKAVGGKPVGYDHNFALSKPSLKDYSARVNDPKSGRTLSVYTTQPAIQLYTGNFLDGSKVGIGGAYHQYGALCLETQHFPDAVHHPNFPPIILRPGEEYRHTAVYAFGAAQA